MKNPRILARVAARPRWLLALAGLALVLPNRAQSPASGTIEGRVLNPGTGEFVENARITIEGTSLETFSDSAGQYRLTHVPAGVARVRAFRTGAPAQTQSVTVNAGQTQQQDFNLAGLGPIRLE